MAFCMKTEKYLTILLVMINISCLSSYILPRPFCDDCAAQDQKCLRICKDIPDSISSEMTKRDFQYQTRFGKRNYEPASSSFESSEMFSNPTRFETAKRFNTHLRFGKRRPSYGRQFSKTSNFVPQGRWGKRTNHRTLQDVLDSSENFYSTERYPRTFGTSAAYEYGRDGEYQAYV